MTKKKQPVQNLPTTVEQADIVLALPAPKVEVKGPVSEKLVDNIEKMRKESKHTEFKIEAGKHEYKTINEKPIEKEAGKPTKFMLVAGNLVAVKDED